jgi:hypothetical protein
MSGLPQLPIVLTDKLKDLNDKFYLLLNEIVKTYPPALSQASSPSKFDSNQTNNGIYTANMAQMLSLQNEYFLYKNNVVRASQAMDKAIQAINDKITTLEGKNKVLNAEYANLKSTSYSAEGLFDDTQISRNQLLISNFILFAVMCGGGFMYYKSTTK